MNDWRPRHVIRRSKVSTQASGIQPHQLEDSVNRRTYVDTRPRCRSASIIISGRCNYTHPLKPVAGLRIGGGRAFRTQSLRQRKGLEPAHMCVFLFTDFGCLTSALDVLTSRKLSFRVRGSDTFPRSIHNSLWVAYLLVLNPKLTKKNPTSPLEAIQRPQLALCRGLPDVAGADSSESATDSSVRV